MSAHTPGRLVALHFSRTSNLETADGAQLVAHVLANEDARRLVACWNALNGIPTEKIENLPRSIVLTVSERLAVIDTERAGLESRIAAQREEIGRLHARVEKHKDELAQSAEIYNTLSAGFAALQADRDAARVLLQTVLTESDANIAAIERAGGFVDAPPLTERIRAFLK